MATGVAVIQIVAARVGGTGDKSMRRDDAAAETPAPTKPWEADSSLTFPARQEEIARRLRALTESDVACFGRMNVSQMLWHLRGAFRMALQREPCRRRFSPLRGPWGRYLVLKSSLPWRAGYPTLPELDVLRVGVPVAEFIRIQDEVIDLELEFVEAAPEELLREHPFLGKMGRESWMRWGYRHTDHHLRQFGR